MKARGALVSDVASCMKLLTLSSIENAKDTLCRNITIYGRCRYEDKGAPIPLPPCSGLGLTLASVREGCAFNHDLQKFSPAHQSDRLGCPGTGLCRHGQVGWMYSVDSGLREVQ